MRAIIPGIVAAGLLFAQAPRWPPQPPPRPMPPEIVPDLSRDVVKFALGQYNVETENEQVRVLRARLGPDQTVPVHDAQSGVLVALTETHVRFIRPDQRMHYVDLDPGRVQWIFEDSYAARNVSDKPVEFLFIELKRARPATR